MGISVVWIFVFMCLCFFYFLPLYPLVFSLLAFYPVRSFGFSFDFSLRCLPILFIHTFVGVCLDMFCFVFPIWGYSKGRGGDYKKMERWGRKYGLWRRRQWIGWGRVGQQDRKGGSAAFKGFWESGREPIAAVSWRICMSMSYYER